MTKWLAWLLVVALIHLTTLVEPASASPAVETQGEQVRVAVGKMEKGSRTLVTVTLRNKTMVTGYLDALGAHSFFVTDPKTHVSTQIAYGSVQQINAMSTRAKVAITAGAVAGAIILLYWIPRIGGV